MPALLKSENVLTVVDCVVQLQKALEAFPVLRPIVGELMRGTAAEAERAAARMRSREDTGPRPQGRRVTGRRVVKKKSRKTRTLTAAQKLVLSKRAKARWKAAKKAGKNTIGGADE